MKTKIIILISGIFLLGITTIGCSKQNKKNQNATATKTIDSKKTMTEMKGFAKIESSKVCYVNNKFMGIEQIPVEFEGKLYYGCCEGCVAKIKTMPEVRYAIDPQTGNKVDKALAYIVLKPHGNNDVLYFESEKSYSNYIN